MTRKQAFWTLFWLFVVIAIAGTYFFSKSLDSLMPSDHPKLEVFSWVAQVFLAVFAFIALGYAASQIDEATSMRRNALLQARAQFLLTLDQRWDAPEVAEAFREFESSKREAIAEINAHSPNLADSAKVQRAANAFPAKLRHLRENEPARYSKFVLILGFCETMGVMVKKEYVDAEDIYDLFGGGLIEVGTFMGQHVDDRQNEIGVLKGLFEHAMLLVRKMDEIRSKRSGATP